MIYKEKLLRPLPDWSKTQLQIHSFSFYVLTKIYNFRNWHTILSPTTQPLLITTNLNSEQHHAGWTIYRYITCVVQQPIKNYYKHITFCVFFLKPSWRLFYIVEHFAYQTFIRRSPTLSFVTRESGLNLNSRIRIYENSTITCGQVSERGWYVYEECHMVRAVVTVKPAAIKLHKRLALALRLCRER